MNAPASDTDPANLTSLLEQLGDSFLLTDRNGVIQYVNPAFEQMTGYSLTEVAGQTPRVLRSGHHPEQVYKELWDTITAGKVFRFIFTNRKKSGDVYEEGMMISPLVNGAGEITHFASMGRAIRESRQTYDLFTLLADSSPVGVYLLRDGKFFYVNKEFERRTGYSADELIGKDWWLMIAEEDREGVRRSATAMLSGEQALPFEYRITTKDGDVRWVLESVRSVDFRGGRSTTGVFAAGNFIDITDRKQSEQQLKQAFSLYAATVESTADGIAVIDNAGEIVAYNQKWMEMWRLTVPSTGELDALELRSVMMAQLLHPDQITTVVTNVMAHPEIETSATLDFKDGRVLEIYSKPQYIEDSIVGRVWSFRDITERRQFETQLIHMASHDPLTGLLNRRGFYAAAEPAITSSSQNALLLLDLDNFKDVNDSLGHQAGDEVLVQISQLLQRTLPAHVVARFGGDEFAVLLHGVSSAGGRHIAESVLATISNGSFTAAGVSVVATASAGLAFAPAGSASVDDLVCLADLAMYEAKARGRDRFAVFSSRLRAGKVQLNRDWQNSLRDAIRANALRLQAQPIVDLLAGETVQRELVIRLPSVQGLPLAARDVSAVAERIGMGRHLDRWLVQQTAEVLQQMRTEADRSALVLSLSSRAMRDGEVMEEFNQVLKDCQAQGGTLVLRLGEGALKRPGELLRTVEGLRALGCRFSVDDLQGSMTLFRSLKDLPVDYLRLDRGLIRDVATSQASWEIVRGLVLIARGLGLKTVAEAANDERTADALRSLGVDLAIGSHLGRARQVRFMAKPVIMAVAA